MGISRRTRLAQKRRWRPSVTDLVWRTFRKHPTSIINNITRHNALFAAIRRNGKLWDEARGIKREIA